MGKYSLIDLFQSMPEISIWFRYGAIYIIKCEESTKALKKLKYNYNADGPEYTICIDMFKD